MGYVLIIPFYRVFSSSLSTYRWIAIVLMLLVIAQEGFRGRLFKLPLLLPMGAFIGAILLSIGHSVDPDMGIRYLKKDILQMVALFYACYIFLSERKTRVRLMAWTLLLSSFFVLVSGVVNPHYKRGRFSATFQSPTKYGKFLDLVLPLAWSYVWVWSPWWALLAVALAVGETVALAFTATRSSLLSIPAMVGVQGILLGRWKRLALVFPLILALMAGTFFLGGRKAMKRFERFSRAVAEKKSGADPSLKTRIAIYKTAWALIKERPILGWGYGRKIERVIVEKQGLEWYRERNLHPFTFHTHSTILEVWLQCGLIGLVAFLWLMVAFWFKAVRALRGVRNLGDRYFALYLGFLGGLGAFTLHSLITSILQLRHELLMMVFMASVMALATGGTSEEDSPGL